MLRFFVKKALSFDVIDTSIQSFLSSATPTTGNSEQPNQRGTVGHSLGGTSSSKTDNQRGYNDITVTVRSGNRILSD